MVDAVVVGGGVSGLTAAYLLTKQKKHVVLIAPEPLGGMLVTKKQDGFTLEQGPNVLLEKPEMSALIDSLNLRHEVVYPVTDNYRQYVWHQGRAYQVPKSLPRFIGTQLFSVKEKLRILRALFVGAIFKPQAEDETVANFFARGLGMGVTRRTLDPVLKGIYGGSVDQLSARALFPFLWDSMTRGESLFQYMKGRKQEGRAKPKTFVFRSGMQTLVERLRAAAGESLQIVSGRVSAVELEQSPYRIELESGASFIAAQLVLALPAREVAKIIKAPASHQQAHEFLRCAALRRYAPLTLVHCATEQMPSFPHDTFGILFPEGTEHLFLGAMFNSLLFPHLAPKGKQLLTLCFGGINALEHPAALSPSAEVIAALCKKYLGVSNFTQLASYRWEGAIPQYEIGHQTFLKSMIEFEQRYSGIALALVDRGGVGVPDRIRSVMELINQ
jgi:protoporphyrinogen/coproporphyrinogen III oxidase